MRRARRKIVGPVAVFGALGLGFSLFTGAAIAAPTLPDDEDIAEVESAAADTAAAIAALEGELIGNQDAVAAADIAAALAAEAYNEAVVALEAAEAEQAAAEREARTAATELEAASAALADLAMASYRSGGELAQLGQLLSADGFEDAVAEATTFQVLGTSTAAAERRFADAEVAAQVADQRATAAVTERTAAAAELETAATEAETAADTAAAMLASTQQRHGELVGELAALRETSVAMEEARQQAAAEARLAEQNAAAAASLGVEAPASPAPADDDAADGEPDAPATSRPSADPAPTTDRPSAAPSPSPTTARPTTPAPAPTTSRPATPRPTTPPTTKPPTTKPPAPPVTTPPPSSSANAAALAWARTQLGKPYVYGAAGPSSYDCSGLTMRAYQNAGISIPRNSKAQYYSGDYVPVGQMKPGDLFFYSNNGSASGIYHVAIYAGNGMRLHAPSPGKTVELVPMWWQNVLPNAVRP